MRLASLYRYCKWDMLDAALALGWMVSAPLHYPHGAYAVLVEFPCDCEAKWPEAKA